MVYYVGIAGRMGSGKSTLAKSFLKMFEGIGLDVTVMHLADELKLKYYREHIYKAGDGYVAQEVQLAYVNANKDVARPHLQRIGTNMCEQYGEDVWVNKLYSLTSCYQVVIVPDVRFDNEARAMDYLVQLDVPHVVRAGRINIINGDHASEAGISVLADILLTQWSYPKGLK